VSERTDELLDEIIRLLALSLRQGMETQTEAINGFADAGLSNNRIAELLGTTPDTVKTTRKRAARRTAAKKTKAE
jgi:DNA-binding CsgD family transcriptional regulator